MAEPQHPAVPSTRETGPTTAAVPPTRNTNETTPAVTPTVTSLLQGSLLDTDQGGIAFCGVTLIEGTDPSGIIRRVVVDPGSSGRRDAVLRALLRRGLTGSDIDAVVLTHAHWDHMQNLDPFDRAVILVHPAELNYIRDPHPGDFATPRWTKAVLDCYDVQEVVEGAELMTGARILEAPGHSAGTIAVAADTADGTAFITGDAVQNAAVAVAGRNALVFWNEQQANRSVRRLVEQADVLYPGHDRSFRLSASGEVSYQEEVRLAITGITATTPGVTLSASPPLSPQVFEPGPSYRLHRGL